MQRTQWGGEKRWKVEVRVWKGEEGFESREDLLYALMKLINILSNQKENLSRFQDNSCNNITDNYVPGKAFILD